jgi:hypothetical protein
VWLPVKLIARLMPVPMMSVPMMPLPMIVGSSCRASQLSLTNALTLALTFNSLECGGLAPLWPELTDY